MERNSEYFCKNWRLDFFAALLFAACFCCLGCGESPPVAPVSGKITFEGQPLAGAAIATQPIATDKKNVGIGSFGKTDAQGRYELELVKPAMKGAIIGKHRVMISRSQADEAEATAAAAADTAAMSEDDPLAHRKAVDRSWPSKFTDGSLTLTVPPEGTDQANFDLKR